MISSVCSNIPSVVGSCWPYYEERNSTRRHSTGNYLIKRNHVLRLLVLLRNKTPELANSREIWNDASVHNVALHTASSL